MGLEALAQGGVCLLNAGKVHLRGHHGSRKFSHQFEG